MRMNVFLAVSNPAGRKIIHLLAAQKVKLSAVAENFSISRPAISKHIKILTECGLVIIRQQGRDRVCEVRLEKLDEISKWAGQYKKFWETKLDHLDNYLTQLQKTSTTKKHGSKRKK